MSERRKVGTRPIIGTWKEPESERVVSVEYFEALFVSLLAGEKKTLSNEVDLRARWRPNFGSQIGFGRESIAEDLGL